MAVITTQPEDYYGVVGSKAVFHVRVSGENLKYKWQYANTSKTPLVFGETTEEGYLTDTLIVAVTEERLNLRCYRCVIVDGKGNTVISEPGYLFSYDRKPEPPPSEPEKPSHAVSLEEMKQYLRVDYDEDDSLISYFIGSAEKICMDILRIDSVETLHSDSNAKAAVMYTVGYLYEHREEADHHALMLTLRALLFGSRREVF